MKPETRDQRPETRTGGVYLVEQRDHLAQSQPVEDAQLVQRRHRQHRHALLLPQHAAGRQTQAPQEPGAGGPPPGPLAAAPEPRAVAHVTQQREQEEQRGAHVGAAHHAGHRLGVHGVGGEQQPGQEAPGPAPQQEPGQQGEEARHGPVERHVDQVVAPRVQPAQGVVETEGQGAQRPVGLVAAAVGQQGAPEVVVEYVGPGGLRQQVLVGLDGPAGMRAMSWLVVWNTQSWAVGEENQRRRHAAEYPSQEGNYQC